MIPGWDNKVSGLQFGLLVAIVIIFLIGMVARQIIINLMPRLLKSFGDEKEAIKAFKVWGKKKFMGKQFMGLIRSTFVIKNNKIIKEWRSVKVKDHAQEVLDFIKNY